MSFGFLRGLCGVLSRPVAPARMLLEEHERVVQSLWLSPVVTLKTSAPLRSEPQRKKKRKDPQIAIMIKDRLMKKLKKLGNTAPEFIPIEDFIVPTKLMDETRERGASSISFEESERRALLLKEWSLYRKRQNMAEMEAIKLALEAQRQALEELKLESEELFHAALKPDPLLFPFTHEGPVYTPPIPNYYAPDGKYNDITKVYTR